MHLFQICTDNLFYTDNKKDCDDYNITTSAEISDDEELQKKRQPKKKSYVGFVTGTCYYLKILKKELYLVNPDLSTCLFCWAI